MIPIKLQLSGFLSYRDPVEMDFTTFELACISGSNGLLPLAGVAAFVALLMWLM